MPELTALNPNYRTPPTIIAAIIGISAVASLFLAWLVYYHPPVDAAGTHLTFLPALDAILNALCAIFLLIGFNYIRRRKITAHRNSMFAAFVVSSAFLVAYIANHVLHGALHLSLDSAAATHLARGRRAANDPHHVLPLSHRSLSSPSQTRPLDLPHLALRLSQRSRGLRYARSLPLTDALTLCNPIHANS
jgi:hypothetical protein